MARVGAATINDKSTVFAMSPVSSSITNILSQHSDDASQLRSTRSVLCRASHVELSRLARLDERLVAHLDGLTVAKEAGRKAAQAALAAPGCGTVFVTSVLSLNAQDRAATEAHLVIAEALHDAFAGFISALGWVSGSVLRGLIRDWLAGPSIAQQTAALAACRFHGVNPREFLEFAINHEHPQLAACGSRVAVTLGLKSQLPLLINRVRTNEASELNAWLSLSTAMLGDRTISLDSLKVLAHAGGPICDSCFGLVVLALPQDSAHIWIREWASRALNEPKARRRQIRGCGLTGDVRYVPWLIEQMNDLTVSRLAGEAFSFITGANLAPLDLERKPPENAPSGPTDDPEDNNVAMDEDDGLPWPDVVRVHAWWQSNSVRFPAGHRYLVGAPVSEAQCIKVLHTGGQRQRAVAAAMRCILKPGTPLFQVAAPAWRQKRWLAQLTA